MSIPDEEFEVLSEEDLVLLTKRFVRMYENRRSTRRNSGLCYKCGKHGHFIAEYPMADENKVEYKHRPKNDYKHSSRNDYNSKSKSKNKDERRMKKSGSLKKKSHELWLPVRATSTPALATPRRARVVKRKMKAGTREGGTQARTSTA